MNMQRRALRLSNHEYLALAKDKTFTAFSVGNNVPVESKLATKLDDLSMSSKTLVKYMDYEVNNKLFPLLDNVSHDHDLHVFYKLGGTKNYGYCLESEDIKPLPPFLPQKYFTSSLVSKTHGILDICGAKKSNVADQEWETLRTINYLAVEFSDNDDEEKKEEFDSSKDNNDTKGKKWQPLTQTSLARCLPAVCEVSNDKLFIAGGDTTKGFTDAVEIFDYKTKEWIVAKEMKNPRRSAGCCYWKEREEIVIGGGYDTTYSKKVERYDIIKNKWMNVKPDAKFGHGGGPNIKIKYDYCNNGLITIGGQDYIEFIDIRDNNARWISLCDIGKKVGYRKNTLSFIDRPLYSLFNI